MATFTSCDLDPEYTRETTKVHDVIHNEGTTRLDTLNGVAIYQTETGDILVIRETVTGPEFIAAKTYTGTDFVYMPRGILALIIILVAFITLLGTASWSRSR